MVISSVNPENNLLPSKTKPKNKYQNLYEKTKILIIHQPCRYVVQLSPAESGNL